MSVTPGTDQMNPIEVVAASTDPVDLVRSKLQGDQEDPFYVVDLGRLHRLHHTWSAALPEVQPFYAVKCNNDKVLLSVLAWLGVGFDCASKQEMQTILSLGVPPQRIIYANPCKQVSHIKFAAGCGVNRMTFDNKIELGKMAKAHPNGELVVRIRADDPKAVCNLGCKFGATVPEAFHLLDTAKGMNLNVVGVSFHIGSGSEDPKAYTRAIEMAHTVFQYGESIGYNFTLLDIGGGFPGGSNSNHLFTKMSNAINTSVREHFSDKKNLKVIAEPGRFFAASTHTLAVCVISKREMEVDGEKIFRYYVNDGLYGSFNCIVYDHATPQPELVVPKQEDVYRCSIWGPTCDGLDMITEDRFLPEVNVGDWLYFEDMGAYTVAASSTFNGFQKPRSFYYTSTAEILEGFHGRELFTEGEGFKSPQFFPVVVDDMRRMEQVVS